jgi:hypothetical protein
MTSAMRTFFSLVFTSLSIPFRLAVLLGELFVIAALFFAFHLLGKRSDALRTKQLSSKKTSNSLLAVSR